MPDMPEELDGPAREAAMKEYHLTRRALDARQGIPPGKSEEIAVGCAIVAYLKAAPPRVKRHRLTAPPFILHDA